MQETGTVIAINIWIFFYFREKLTVPFELLRIISTREKINPAKMFKRYTVTYRSNQLKFLYRDHSLQEN